jgi:hypothetical protein
MATATSLSGAGRRNAYDAIAAGTTDSALVAAEAGLRIVVTSVVINHGDTTPSAVTFTSKGSGAGTAIYAPLKGPANGGFVIPDNDYGLFGTVAGEGLSVTTGAGSTTSVAVTYKRVK